ncbi:MAG: TIGR04076 family protein [Bacteroidales bacterium]|nr:TIGR04076 family protein [Bacteroidales bacterium]
MDLKIEIIEIKGNCPVYKIGDTFLLKDGYKLVSDIPLCMHSLSSLMPFYNVLRFNSPKNIGLAGVKEKNSAFIQCPDACSFTRGGSVVFKIENSDL